METKTAKQLIEEELIDKVDLRLFPGCFTGTIAIIFPSLLAITEFISNLPSEKAEKIKTIWSDVKKTKEGMLLLFGEEDFEKIVKPLLP